MKRLCEAVPVTNDEPTDEPGREPTAELTEERSEPAVARRFPRAAVIVLVAAAVLVAGGAVAAAVLPAERVSGQARASRPAAEARTTIGRECLEQGGRFQLLIYFDRPEADDDMRAAAAALDADPRVSRVRTETRNEAYVRFKEIFADRPDMIEVVRPEALPASVLVLPIDAVAPTDLADDLPDEVVGVDSVELEACLLPGRPGR